MAEDEQQQEPKQTQQTQPRQGEPIEIPVPKRSAWERVLQRAAKTPSSEDD
jgi:hypothetical protein